MRFFTGHVTTELTVYQQTSKNLLVRQPVAASSGFTGRFVNAGEMVNKGIEFSHYLSEELFDVKARADCLKSEDLKAINQISMELEKMLNSLINKIAD